MPEAVTTPDLAGWLAARWSPRGALIVGGLLLAAILAAGRGGHVLYGVLWAACVAIAAVSGAQTRATPDGGTALLRRALGRALAGAALAFLVVGAWSVLDGWGSQRQVLWGLSGNQVVAYAALSAAGAGPLLAVVARRGSGSRRRAVALGLGATALLAAWFVVAAVQLAYIDGVPSGLTRALRAALEHLEAIGDRPGRAVCVALGFAAPFGLAAYALAARLPLGRALLVVLLGGLAWSTLLHDLAWQGSWDAPPRLQVQAPGLVVAGALLLLEAVSAAPAPPPP